jgi:glycosyltransferase involved in cell wall biosynthesis
MPQPKVTIVTPSLNQGHFIRATIESVLSQAYDNLEYIIMDGGSTDETAAVVRDYSSRLTWISEPDRGQSHAINKGFRRAAGQVVAWLNSDDLLLPGAVQRAVAALEAQTDVAAIYGEGYLIDRDGAAASRFPCTEPFNLWKLVYLSDYVLQQTVFFRKEVFEHVGYVDEQLHYAMDWDLLIRIGKRYPLGYVPEYLGCLREYPEAKSFSGGARRIAEIREVMRRHTGRRIAPGYIIYGLETYRGIWCDWVDRHTPRALRWPSHKLQQAIQVAAGRVIGRTILHSQGWYGDRWASREVKLMTPASAEALVLRGFNPLDGRRRLRLAIYSNGSKIGEYPLDHGGFELRIALEKTGEPAQLVINAAGAPRWIRRSPDGGVRVYRLDEARAVCAAAFTRRPCDSLAV